MQELIQKIMDFLQNFDPSKILPNIAKLMTDAVVVLRICVLAGPILLAVLGAVYFFLAPKEANHSVGYRFFWGMSSMEAWQFMQKLSGMVWGALGIVLLVIMLIVSGRFGAMDAENVAFSALRCVLWELGLTVAASLGVDITMMVLFDRTGARRKQK